MFLLVNQVSPAGFKLKVKGGQKRQKEKSKGVNERSNEFNEAK